MRGNKSVSLQPRDIRLLQELAVMRFADREQMRIAAGFGSTTRINARLLALTRAGLLKRFFLGSGGGRKALYSLSRKGAALAEVQHRGIRRKSDEIVFADYFIQHQLTINAIYCALKFGVTPVPGVTFQRWLPFNGPVVPGLGLIPDGYLEFTIPSGGMASFIEVDLGHENLTVWKEKVRHYLQLALSGEFEAKFGRQRFRVLVLLNSDRRLHSIRKAIAAMTEKIFWFATLDSVQKDFFASVWFRPAGDKPKSLFEENQ